MSKINKKIIFFLLCGLFSASYETYCDQMNGDNGKSPSDENSCALLSGPNVHDDICCFYTLVDTSLSSGSNPIPKTFVIQFHTLQEQISPMIIIMVLCTKLIAVKLN